MTIVTYRHRPKRPADPEAEARAAAFVPYSTSGVSLARTIHRAT